MNTIRKISFAAALVAAGGFAADSLAGSATANMNLSAAVSENCVINEVTPGTFPYNGLAANLTAPFQASFAVTYACTDGATPTITLNEGMNPFAGSTPVAPNRQMANGSSRLAYNLFASPGNQITGSVGVAWGTNPAMGPTLGLGVGLEQSVLAYLTIFPGQTLPAGTYSDTVAMTVNF